jgi:recombination protein RecA
MAANAPTKDNKSASAAREEQQEKLKAMSMAIAQIKERFGDGSIMKLGEHRRTDVDVIPSGCLSLDVALGVGGFPRGRIIEIYGPEASGKTTLTLHAIAEVQKLGGTAAFVDAEHALDPAYAAKIGVNINELLVSQPDNGEQALEIVETLVRSSAVDIVIVDSVAALVPKNEIEGEMGDSHMGLQARLMSQALRKLTAIVAKTKTVVIFINQIRMKIGVVFGNPETTTGGTALKFYSSLRIEVRRSAQIKREDKVIGNQTNVKIVKNKVAGDLITFGTEKGVVTKNGNSYSFGETKMGVGIENAKAFLKGNLALQTEIRNAVTAKVNAEMAAAPASPNAYANPAAKAEAMEEEKATA